MHLYACDSRHLQNLPVPAKRYRQCLYMQKITEVFMSYQKRM